MANQEKDKTEAGGSTYTISGGQQGAVGDNARADHFTQVSQQAGVDIKELTDNLERLRAAMASQATDSEHYIALGNVAAAEKEAKAGNQDKAIEYLKSAGSWALAVAEKIGITVITKVVQGQLGM
jgi:hypothetical protein